MIRTNSIASLLVPLIFSCADISAAPKKKIVSTVEGATATSTMLWNDPGDIASRDLFYGPGGKKEEPHGKFTFEKEDLDGTNPKFVVRDEDGTKWKVKLGDEARPETAASRFVWAAGYFADEDYFMKDFKVDEMPSHLHRGAREVGPGGTMHNVRLKKQPKGEKKEGDWKWRDDPFTGTRELNGLRVLMALINNWDLKDVNNSIRQNGTSRVYLVSDLGASFGTTGRSVTRAKSKGNVGEYEKSAFITKKTAEFVDFKTPSRPALIHVFELPEFIRRVHYEWIGKRIPRSDAKWLGHLLAKLSDDQVRSAFRAAGYSQQEIDGFSNVMEKRIAELAGL